jgi:hypothetical protein
MNHRFLLKLDVVFCKPLRPGVLLSRRVNLLRSAVSWGLRELQRPSKVYGHRDVQLHVQACPVAWCATGHAMWHVQCETGHGHVQHAAGHRVGDWTRYWTRQLDFHKLPTTVISNVFDAVNKCSRQDSNVEVLGLAPSTPWYQVTATATAKWASDPWAVTQSACSCCNTNRIWQLLQSQQHQQHAAAA